MPRYIFDVTDLRQFLALSPALSGIQRVVVMTLAHAQRQLGHETIWLGYFDKRRRRYCVVLPSAAMNLERTDHLRAVLNVHTRPKALPGMARYSRRKVRRQLKIWLLDLCAKTGYRRPFMPLQMTPEDWRHLRRPARDVSPHQVGPSRMDAVADPGDWLLLLDNVQKQTALLPYLRSIGGQGIKIAVLIHDMIPLVTPEFTEGETPRRTLAWLESSTAFVSRYIANSRNTASDLKRFLDNRGAKQPIDVVPLAQATLVTREDDKADLSEADRRLYPTLASSFQVSDRIRGLGKMDFVLVVGTREARKNLWSLARAWDRLRQQDDVPLPKLVIAGRRGWLNEDFEALMTSTGNLGGWVEIVEGPSDRELDWLYSHCLFTAMVSYYEGWGLPIGESLAYGKTAVVSQTASMPEVGGDMVVYCDPRDVFSIEAACRSLIVDGDLRRTLEERIRSTPLRGWDAVASDLIAAVR